VLRAEGSDEGRGRLGEGARGRKERVILRCIFCVFSNRAILTGFRTLSGLKKPGDFNGGKVCSTEPQTGISKTTLVPVASESSFFRSIILTQIFAGLRGLNHNKSA